MASFRVALQVQWLWLAVFLLFADSLAILQQRYLQPHRWAMANEVRMVGDGAMTRTTPDAVLPNRTSVLSSLIRNAASDAERIELYESSQNSNTTSDGQRTVVVAPAVPAT